MSVCDSHTCTSTPTPSCLHEFTVLTQPPHCPSLVPLAALLPSGLRPCPTSHLCLYKVPHGLWGLSAGLEEASLTRGCCPGHPFPVLGHSGEGASGQLSPEEAVRLLWRGLAPPPAYAATPFLDWKRSGQDPDPPSDAGCWCPRQRINPTPTPLTRPAPPCSR